MFQISLKLFLVITIMETSKAKCVHLSWCLDKFKRLYTSDIRPVWPKYYKRRGRGSRWSNFVTVRSLPDWVWGLKLIGQFTSCGNYLMVIWFRTRIWCFNKIYGKSDFSVQELHEFILLCFALVMCAGF